MLEQQQSQKSLISCNSDSPNRTHRRQSKLHNSRVKRHETRIFHLKINHRFNINGRKIFLLSEIPLAGTVFTVAPSSTFKVTDTSLQFDFSWHEIVPDIVAFNCRKFMSLIGFEATSIVCWSGKNL